MTDKSQIYPHEWLAILTIAAVMGVLTLIAQTNLFRPLPSTTRPHYVVDQKITVFVEGACEFPGRYEFQKGARIEELLELIKPFPGTTVTHYKPESKLRDGQIVRVKPPKVKYPKKRAPAAR